MVAFLSAASSYAVEKVYERERYFEQYNTLFGADPNQYLTAFANGWGGSSFRHPAVAPLIGVPTRAIALATATVTEANERRLRHELALAVVPLAQGLKAALIYLSLVMLGLATVPTLLVCLLNLVGFSSVTIGSIPESFLLSSMFIAAFLYLSIRELGHSTSRTWLWIGTGALATGITLTNIVPMFLFYVGALRCGRAASWTRALVQSSTLCSASFVLAFAIGVAGALAYSKSPEILLPRSLRGDLGSAMASRPIEDFVIASINTFPPAIEPDVVVNELYADRNPALPSRFAYSSRRLTDPFVAFWAAGFVSLLAWGGWQASRSGHRWRMVAAVSAALIGFNFLLHLVFQGRDIFLYTLHWQVPMLILLAGIGLAHLWKLALGTWLLLALGLWSIVADARFLARLHEVAGSSRPAAEHSIPNGRSVSQARANALYQAQDPRYLATIEKTKIVSTDGQRCVREQSIIWTRRGLGGSRVSNA